MAGFKLIDSYTDSNGNEYDVILYPYGTTVYYKNGEVHREDGPAIIDGDGGRTWKQKGLRHRLDGPAVTEQDGTKEWWIEGVFIRGELPYPWSSW